MLRKSFVVGYCLFLSLLQLAQAQTPEKLYQDGMRKYALKHYQEAEQEFSQALQTKPEFAEARLQRAYCRLQLKDYTGAHKDLDGCRDRLYKAPELHLAYGFMYNVQGKYQAAADAYSEAIRLNPKYALAYNNRGLAYQNMGNYRAAISEYSLAIQADSGFALAYNNRSTAVYYNQDIAEANKTDLYLALRDLGKALKLDSNLCVAHRNKGVIYYLLEKYEESEGALTEALVCQPDNNQYYLDRGQSRLKLKDFEGALADFEQAWSGDSLMITALLERGTAKAWLGDFTGARQDAQEAIGRNRDYSGMAYHRMAITAVLEGDIPQCIQFLKKADRAGYFRVKTAWTVFQQDSAFSEARKDEDFKEAVARIYKHNKRSHAKYRR